MQTFIEFTTYELMLQLSVYKETNFLVLLKWIFIYMKRQLGQTLENAILKQTYTDMSLVHIIKHLNDDMLCVWLMIDICRLDFL